MIILQDDLTQMSGYKRQADIERWLLSNRIGYTRGRDGIISTTLEALNEVTVIKRNKATKVSFDG